MCMRPCGPIRNPRTPRGTYHYHIEVSQADGTVSKTQPVLSGTIKSRAIFNARKLAGEAWSEGIRTKWVVTVMYGEDNKAEVVASGGFEPSGKLFRDC